MDETPETHQTVLELVDDSTVLRIVVEDIITILRNKDGRTSSRERALAVVKLQEAAFWLSEDVRVS